ncbi:MAG TPA: tetratricopeptide repeat protein [Acidobacteriota bacterium]|nr:tetratricopeptide repeat protein [Acidobacteriota bacterium]
MLKKMRLFRFWIPFIVCAAIFPAVLAQDTLEDFKYNEDYNRVQSILKIPDVAKRADRMVTFYTERKDVKPELRDYADSMFAKDLEVLMQQGNFAAMKNLCERALKARSRFAEAYLFYGVALKRDKKTDEAVKAFARAYVLANPIIKPKAKQQLDVTYRSTGGSLAGEDKLIKETMAEFGIKPPRK